MTLTLSFHGAVGTVTGSCYALERGRETVLVDCGLFQGTKSVRALNYAGLPVDPARVSAVLITHAHIDHCGLLPKLVAHGWEGPVYCTAATADLMDFMLRDTAHIQEFEVERLNRRNRRRGRPTVDPIYTREDAAHAVSLLRPVAYRERAGVTDWLTARFWNAGHILGAASIELEASADHGDGPMRLVFSGDIGPGDKAFHDDPEGPSGGIDHMILESTYGGRIRPPMDEAARQAELARVMRAAIDRGGPILMPVFAVERTQELLYDLDCLIDRGELPDLETFLDSPLAIRATEAFDRHLPQLNKPGTPHPFRRKSLHLVMEARESQKLAQLRGPILIMAGSGMCDAGRIREHIADHLWRPETTLVIVGYQAPGTLGRLIADSQSAVGNLQVAQAGNQIEALQTEQLMQMEAMMAAHYRAEALERARQLAEAERGRARTRAFLAE
jgi:metallo-beta-lactamase family protein